MVASLRWRFCRVQQTAGAASSHRATDVRCELGAVHRTVHGRLRAGVARLIARNLPSMAKVSYSLSQFCFHGQDCVSTNFPPCENYKARDLSKFEIPRLRSE